MQMNKPSKELLIDLVNLNWKTNYTSAQVDFENLEIMPADAQLNTGITIKPIGTGSPLKAARQIYYDRVHLAVLAAKFTGPNGVLDLEDQGYLTTHDLLPAINEALGTGMTEDDIVDAALPTSGPYPRGVVIHAKPTSLVYFGQLQIQINGANAPDDDETGSDDEISQMV